MAVVIVLAVWLASLHGGANSACMALKAIHHKHRPWVGYPVGWKGYDEGQGAWSWLPIGVESGLLVINQEHDNEIWVFVMRSGDNHDFCGPVVLEP